MTARPASLARALNVASRFAIGSACRASFSPPGKSISLITSINNSAVRDLRCFLPCRLYSSALTGLRRFLEEFFHRMLGPLLQTKMVFLAELVLLLNVLPELHS